MGVRLGGEQRLGGLRLGGGREQREARASAHQASDHAGTILGLLVSVLTQYSRPSPIRKSRMTGLTPSRCDAGRGGDAGDHRRPEKGGGPARQRIEPEGLGAGDPSLGLMHQQRARGRLQRSGRGAQQAARDEEHDIGQPRPLGHRQEQHLVARRAQDHRRRPGSAARSPRRSPAAARRRGRRARPPRPRPRRRRPRRCRTGRAGTGPSRARPPRRCRRR